MRFPTSARVAARTVWLVGASAPPLREAQEPKLMIHMTMYVSTLVDELSDADLEALLQRSRIRNEQVGITGMLVVQGRRVMQMLEGEEHTVQHLFDRIAADVRHHDVVQVWKSSTSDRRFPNWSMAFDDLTETTATTARIPVSSANGPELTPPAADLATARRRELALRRALVSGDQMVVSLAIILEGHRPERVLDSDGATHLRCVECRRGTIDAGYPCNTAQNALWAIESTMPRS